MNIVKFRFKPRKSSEHSEHGNSLADAIICCLIMYLYQFSPLLETRMRKRHTAATAAVHSRRVHSETSSLKQKQSGRQAIYNRKRKLERTIQWIRDNGVVVSSSTIGSNSTSSNSTSSSSNSSQTASSSSKFTWNGGTTDGTSKFSLQLQFSDDLAEHKTE